MSPPADDLPNEELDAGVGYFAEPFDENCWASRLTAPPSFTACALSSPASGETAVPSTGWTCAA